MSFKQCLPIVFAFLLNTCLSACGGPKAPDTLTNTSVQITLKEVSSQLPANQHPAAGAVLVINFLDNGKFTVTETNKIAPVNEGDFTYKKIDANSSEITGHSTTLNKPLSIKLNFKTAELGLFEANIGNNFLIMKGGFSARKIEQPQVKLAGSLQSYLTFTSKITGITYPYHIYLPANYATSNKQYPIVYGTDAQWGFAGNAGYLDYKQKDVIVVGIEQGPDDRRFIDFEPEGAPKYMQFLKQEFIPFIEKELRTTHDRTYMGVSLGGLLGSILLADEPVNSPYFKTYILFDGTYQLLTTDNIHAEEKRFAANTQFNIRVLLTSASPGNRKPNAELAKRYQARTYQGLNLTLKEYNVPHSEIGWPSFSDAVNNGIFDH